MKPEFILTQDLRFIPQDSELLKKYILELKKKLNSHLSNNEKLEIMGEIGVYLRTIDQFDEAKKYLSEVVKILETNKQPLKKVIQNRIRLAHVYQENKEFEQSDKMFSEIISICRTNEDVKQMLHFALQHSGKNNFDQKKYTEALEQFTEALHLRESQQVPQEQIESTRAAIKRTLEVLNK